MTADTTLAKRLYVYTLVKYMTCYVSHVKVEICLKLNSARIFKHRWFGSSARDPHSSAHAAKHVIPEFCDLGESERVRQIREYYPVPVPPPLLCRRHFFAAAGRRGRRAAGGRGRRADILRSVREKPVSGFQNAW